MDNQNSDAAIAVDEQSNGRDDIIVCRDVHKWFGSFHALKGSPRRWAGARWS